MIEEIQLRIRKEMGHYSLKHEMIPKKARIVAQILKEVGGTHEQVSSIFDGMLEKLY